MDKTGQLVLSVFEQARNVGLGNKRYLEVAPDDILAIARSSAGRAEFSRELACVNDDELRRQIVEFVIDLADSADDNAAEADRGVDLIDRAGMTVTGSVTVAGIGTLVAGAAKAMVLGGLLGPIGLLVGGSAGLAVTGIGRTVLKRRSDRSKSDSRKLRRLVGR